MKYLLLAVSALASASSASSAFAQSVPPAPVADDADSASKTRPVAVAGTLSATATLPIGLPVIRHRIVPPSPAELRVRTANRTATQEPSTIGFMRAVQVYPYSDGTLYQLFTAPERVTDIALQPGEEIVSVAAGDTVRWTVGDTTSGSGDAKRVHIFVKPFSAGLSTNLVITTDRRAYHLQMMSTPATAMAALSWSYPQDDLIAIRRQQAEARAATPISAGLAVDNLYFNYRITGDTPEWRPLRAFDDGRQTFIEFPASIAVGEAPPLFVIDGKGGANLVNYRMSGRFYVVDRLFGVAELRLGGKKQSIVRITRTEPERHGRRAS